EALLLSGTSWAGPISISWTGPAVPGFSGSFCCFFAFVLTLIRQAVCHQAQQNSRNCGKAIRPGKNVLLLEFQAQELCADKDKEGQAVASKDPAHRTPGADFPVLF